MYGKEILFADPKPTGIRPRDLLGLYKPTDPLWRGHREATEETLGGGRGKKRTQPEQGSRREGWRDSRGSAAATPTLKLPRERTMGCIKIPRCDTK